MSDLVAEYNHCVRDINKQLGFIKRGGASYDTILSKITALRGKFTEMLVETRNKKDILSSFKDEKRKRIEKVTLILKE